MSQTIFSYPFFDYKLTTVLAIILWKNATNYNPDGAEPVYFRISLDRCA